MRGMGTISLVLGVYAMLLQPPAAGESLHELILL